MSSLWKWYPDFGTTIPTFGSVFVLKQPAARIMNQGKIPGAIDLDIHEQRANAIKKLARCLLPLMEKFSIHILSLKGGNAHNAIPREAQAMVALNSDVADSIGNIIREFEKTGFGSFGLSGQTLRPLRELFHATVATKPQRSQCFFTTVPVRVSK